MEGRVLSFEKKSKATGAGGVAQVVESLPSKLEYRQNPRASLGAPFLLREVKKLTQGHAALCRASICSLAFQNAVLNEHTLQ
jgi:hypothetical protein